MLDFEFFRKHMECADEGLDIWTMNNPLSYKTKTKMLYEIFKIHTPSVFYAYELSLSIIYFSKFASSIFVCVGKLAHLVSSTSVLSYNKLCRISITAISPQLMQPQYSLNVLWVVHK